MVGLWGGDVAQAVFADTPPRRSPPGPPTCPYYATFLSRSTPASDLAMTEVTKHSMLFFVRLVHRIEITKWDNVDAEEEIHFGDPFPHFRRCPPPMRLTTLWHLGNTAGAWRPPKCTFAGALPITCPCDCKVCPLCIYVCLPAFLTNWSKFARDLYEFRTNKCLSRCVNAEVYMKFVRNW